MAKPNVVSKQQLIQSAKEIIAMQGMEKLTLKSVAERAHVTQGTVYYHFKTKEQQLLAVVEDFCSSSWSELKNDFHIQTALASAKSRCTSDSLYHHLFFQLVANGLQNEQIKEKLGEMLVYENNELRRGLEILWGKSPINGITFESWSIICNALIDGLALQALFSPSFSASEVYEHVFTLIQKLTEGKKGS